MPEIRRAILLDRNNHAYQLHRRDEPVQAFFENISKREEKGFLLAELEGESNDVLVHCYQLCFKGRAASSEDQTVTDFTKFSRQCQSGVNG